MNRASNDSAYRAEVESIQVMGDVATATLVETGFLESDFVDFFHLIRVSGEWKIITKTYHQARWSESCFRLTSRRTCR